MPFLYLYGCLIGMLGGFTVAIMMLDITARGYLHFTVSAFGITRKGEDAVAERVP